MLGIGTAQVEEKLRVRVAVFQPVGEDDGEGGLADAAHSLQTGTRTGDGGAGGFRRGKFLL
jgi:hypothetical protein